MFSCTEIGLYFKRWVNQGRKLSSALPSEPRKCWLQGLGRGLGYFTLYWEGPGFFFHELPHLCPTSTCILYWCGNELILCSNICGSGECSCYLQFPEGSRFQTQLKGREKWMNSGGEIQGTWFAPSNVSWPSGGDEKHSVAEAILFSNWVYR